VAGLALALSLAVNGAERDLCCVAENAVEQPLISGIDERDEIQQVGLCEMHLTEYRNPLQLGVSEPVSSFLTAHQHIY